MPSKKGVLIRRMQPSENRAIHALVQTIADETFTDLFKGQVPIGEAKWDSAWLAIIGDEIVGVTLTDKDSVDDLWVRKDDRRMGIGARLLSEAEREMRERGCHTFRLRVVKSNVVAVQFYQSQGWKVHREFAHEKYGHAMFEMIKSAKDNPLS